MTLSPQHTPDFREASNVYNPAEHPVGNIYTVSEHAPSQQNMSEYIEMGLDPSTILTVKDRKTAFAAAMAANDNNARETIAA